jgi:hypothetical protein
MEERIVTKHPHGKSGRSIRRAHYDTMRQAMLSVLADGDLTHTELMDALTATLKGTFAGNISWYGETVKLDLEARQVIERTATRPTKYRLTRHQIPGSREPT